VPYTFRILRISIPASVFQNYFAGTHALVLGYDGAFSRVGVHKLPVVRVAGLVVWEVSEVLVMAQALARVPDQVASVVFDEARFVVLAPYTNMVTVFLLGEDT